MTLRKKGMKKSARTTEIIIPDKLYFRIGEVADLCRLPAYVLRFWETEFPQLKPVKSSTGQRMYRKRDVESVVRIKKLLYEDGFTIAGARAASARRDAPGAQPVRAALPGQHSVQCRLSTQRASADPAHPVGAPLDLRHRSATVDQKRGPNPVRARSQESPLTAYADLLTASPVSAASTSGSFTRCSLTNQT